MLTEARIWAIHCQVSNNKVVVLSSHSIVSRCWNNKVCRPKLNASKCMHVVHSVGFRKLLVLGQLNLLLDSFTNSSRRFKGIWRGPRIYVHENCVNWWNFMKVKTLGPFYCSNAYFRRRFDYKISIKTPKLVYIVRFRWDEPFLNLQLSLYSFIWEFLLSQIYYTDHNDMVWCLGRPT